MEKGQPVYKDVDYIAIMTAGNKTTVKRRVKTVSDAAGPSDMERFPQQWAAYKANKEQIPNGIPLSEWPAITKAHVLNLRHFKIFTVEQVAEIPDQGLDIIGLGGRALRDSAKAYLSRSVDVSEITRLVARIQALETDNAMLKEQSASRGDTEEEESRRPGRPKKTN